MSAPDFQSPDAALEQYRTPAAVAADLLWEAHQDDAIRGRDVVDLGCGTGMFCVGAMVLRARSVTGVDIDAGALAMISDDRIRTIHADINDVAQGQPPLRADTVLMNPPFGAQNSGADRPFYAAAARILDGEGSAWFLALRKTEAFLGHEAKRWGARLDRVLEWDYPIEARFAFHRHEVRTFDVAGYRMGFD